MERLEAYTVQELIDKLQKVEDKTQKVYYNDAEWGLQPTRHVLKGGHYMVYNLDTDDYEGDNVIILDRLDTGIRERIE
jgi:hypothetical protein